MVQIAMLVLAFPLGAMRWSKITALAVTAGLRPGADPLDDQRPQRRQLRRLLLGGAGHHRRSRLRPRLLGVTLGRGAPESARRS